MDAIDEAIAAYEREIGPENGARVVARAWTDPAFKERLLADPIDAIDTFDFDVGTQHIQVKENTDDVHNVVVCTLCSCYPWSLLGLPPTWYKTPAYRSRIVREPRSVLAEFGVELDDGVGVDVWDSSSELRYMVLPRRPDGTEDYGEDDLADLVTRDAMIGVERFDASTSAGGAGATADGGVADPDSPFADLLGLDAEPTFATPWQARAFGVTVALYDDGDGFDWAAFQRRLIEAVEATDPDADGLGEDATETERIYYEQWHAALEHLLVSQGVFDTARIDARATEFAEGERTAEEFVRGERGH
jgi:nitrile hydratase alpha subunit/nitrile hydratase accessory protein